MAETKSTPNQGTSSQRVVVLKNEKEICRALQYVEDEIIAHLDPTTSDTSLSPSKALLLKGLLKVIESINFGQSKDELSKSIDGLLQTLTDLDQAALALIEGAEVQVIELAEELEGLKTSQSSLLITPLEEVEKELENRAEQREIVFGIQESLENERDALQDEIKTLKIQKKAGGENSAASSTAINQLERKLEGQIKTIQSVVATLSEYDKETAILNAYLNSVRRIQKGLPEGIIGKKMSFK